MRVQFLLYEVSVRVMSGVNHNILVLLANMVLIVVMVEGLVMNVLAVYVLQMI